MARFCVLGLVLLVGGVGGCGSDASSPMDQGTDAANDAGQDAADDAAQDMGEDAAAQDMGEDAPTNDAPTVDAIASVEATAGVAEMVAITLQDAEDVDSVVVTASSDDETIVPNDQLVVSGTGGSRTLTFTPEAGELGVVTITVTLTDGEHVVTTTFDVTVLAPPQIAPISSFTVFTDELGPVTITLSDADDDPADLTLTAVSDNQTALPDAGLVLTGAGASRSLTLMPAAGLNQTVTVLITLVATDPSGGMGVETFEVTLDPSHAPTFTLVPGDQALLEDAANAVRSVTIDDVDAWQPEAGLTFTASSSDPTIVAVTTGGAGANRNVTLDPQLNRFGTATISLRVSDGGRMTETTFDVTISQVNDAPTISIVGSNNVTVTSGTQLTVLYTVADVDRGDGGFPAQAPVQTLTVTSVLSAANGVLVNSLVKSPGSVEITLTPGQTGTATLTFTVTDNGPGTLTGTATFTLTVTP